MARGFMTHLMTPAFLVDEEGVLVFYNDAASEVLGLTFEEAGRMPAREWGARFEPRGPEGETLPVEKLPLSIALEKERAAHSPMRITSASGDTQDIEVTAFPVIGQAGLCGAVAIFWDGYS